MPKDWKSSRYSSVRAVILQFLLKLNRRFWEGRQDIPVAEARRRFDKLAKQIPKRRLNITLSEQWLDGVPLTWFKPLRNDPARVVLYLPGGAFIAGAPTTTHLDLISRLALKCGISFVAVDYRKAPENPFPAALDDVFAAYSALLQGYPANAISVAGDSAGGCLALALGLKLRDEKLEMPGKFVALSPVTDLAGTGSSLLQNSQTDAMVPAWLIKPLADLYAPGSDLTLPYISPLYGDFSGFPSTLIQVSDTEVLLDDARRVADKMRAAGVTVQLDVWHQLPHVWQAFAAVLPEGRAAIKDIADFLNR